MDKFGGAFWVGYVFITLAFIGQLVCAYCVFRTENLKKLFYRLPLVTVSYTALIVTLVVGALCMAVPNLPNWVGIIVCFAVLAFSAIALVKASAAAEIVEEIDEKVAVRTSYIKSLTADAEGLISRAASEPVRAEAKRVYEAVRYSDPMSRAELFSVEDQIKASFDAFSDTVLADSADNAKAVAGELLALLADRNRKCKILK